MKKHDLYPALINWPFLIVGCLVGFQVGYEIYGVPFGILFALLISGYELFRVQRMTNALAADVTLEIIRADFARDNAYHWIPWRDQVRGINEETYTKKQPESV